jgi:hypothetical protein
MSEKMMALRVTVCIGAVHEPQGTLKHLEWLEEKGVTFKVITWKGTGGGWPVFEYYGTEDQLKALLSEEFRYEGSDLEYYLEGAKLI